MRAPRRGEIWRVELEPVRGHEQGGVRPALVISNDIFNTSAADLIVVIPITTRARSIRSFLRVDPPDGGLKHVSYIICDQVRTLSKHRLTRQFGRLSQPAMREVEERVKILLDL